MRRRTFNCEIFTDLPDLLKWVNTNNIYVKTIVLNQFKQYEVFYYK